MPTLQSEPASKIVPILVAVGQVILTSDVISEKGDKNLLYLIALPVVLFYVVWYRNEKTFFAQYVGIGSLLAYVFLKYLYSLGIQLPGKGEEGTLLPVTTTLACSYAALTMAVACMFLYLIGLIKGKGK
jgi:hypothetical protein